MNKTFVADALRARGRRHGKFPLAPLAAAIALYLSGAAQAATIAVNDASDDSVAGKCTLQDAVAALNNASAMNACAAGDGVNDTIDLSFFTQPTTISVTLPNSADGLSAFGFTQPAILSGPLGSDGKPLVTIQRSSVSGVNFRVLGTTKDLTIQGLKITKGNSPGRGAGVYAYTGAKLTIANSIISGNRILAAASTYSGGGISTADGDVTVTDSTVSDNYAPNNGGGIYVKAQATLTLTRCTVDGNSVYHDGGGIYSFAGDVVLNSSTISNNKAGITYIDPNNNNHIPRGGEQGGGIWADRVILTNSTVSGNHINNKGGGIFAYAQQLGRPSRNAGPLQAHNGHGTVYMDFSTVSGNTVYGGNYGGSTGGVSATYYLRAHSSIISGNAAGDVEAGNNMYDFAGDHNIILGDPPGNAPADTLNCDPKLAPLGDYGGPTQTMPLQNGSCAIDAGPETSTLTTDQRGLPRPVGSKTDIGAVEKQGADDPPPDTIFASGFES